LGRTQHGGQIPSQFDLKAALLAAVLGLDSTTSADDVRFQGTRGRREDDGVDEATNGVGGFGPRVGIPRNHRVEEAIRSGCQGRLRTVPSFWSTRLPRHTRIGRSTSIWRPLQPLTKWSAPRSAEPEFRPPILTCYPARLQSTALGTSASANRSVTRAGAAMMRPLARLILGALLAVLGAAPMARLVHAQANPQQPPPQAPPIVVIGGGGGSGGSGGAGGGGAGGAGGGGGGGGTSLYDGYADIDWDGPDEVMRSPLIFQPFDVPSAMEAFNAMTSGLPGSVARQPMTYDEAITHVQALHSAPDAARTFDELRRAAASASGAQMVHEYGIAVGMAGNLETLLATEFALMQANPANPIHAVNVSSLLVQRGMVNEAIALLDRLGASQATPRLAFGFTPGAVVDYARGYTSLLVGELAQAQSLLGRAFNADRSIADASLALAVAQRALGGDPRKAFLEGFLLAYGDKPLMYCGEMFDLDPKTTEEAENVGPPTDALYDLSEGEDGTLPPAPHPAGGPALVRLLEELGGVRAQIQAEIVAHDKRATDLHTVLMDRLASSTPKDTDAADQALTAMIEESNVCLKPLQKMRKQRSDVSEEVDAQLQAQLDALVPEFMELARLGDSPDALPLARRLVSTGVAQRAAPITRWEQAVRLHHKSWHKYATGLASHITDPQWKEYAEETIRGADKVVWMEIYVGTITKYSVYLPAGRQAFAPDPPSATGDVEEADIVLCTPQARKGSVEVQMLDIPLGRAPVHPKVGVSMEVSCDKMAIEMDAQVGVGLPGMTFLGGGGFLEASGKQGELTVAGGAKATGSVVGAGSSTKAGVFMTMNRKGLTSFGVKTDGSQRVGGGVGAKLQTYGSDYVIWSAPARPQRLEEYQSRALYPTVR